MDISALKLRPSKTLYFRRILKSKLGHFGPNYHYNRTYPFVFSQVLVYLSKGRLPWQGVKCANKKQRYEIICERKMSIRPEVLCRGLSAEFLIFFNYVDNLKFDERPDYDNFR